MKGPGPFKFCVACGQPLLGPEESRRYCLGPCSFESEAGDLGKALTLAVSGLLEKAFTKNPNEDVFGICYGIDPMRPNMLQAFVSVGRSSVGPGRTVHWIRRRR